MDNYKQIKADLDDLRLMVEKSELWVVKTKGEEGGKKKKKSDSEGASLCSQVYNKMRKIK